MYSDKTHLDSRASLLDGSLVEEFELDIRIIDTPDQVEANYFPQRTNLAATGTSTTLTVMMTDAGI